MRNALAIVLFAAAISACTQFSLLEPKRTKIGDVISVDPQIAWNKHSTGHNEIWTGDGPLLQEIRFITDVGEGGTIYATNNAEKSKNWPKLKGQKRPNEFMELFVASLTATEANDVKTDNLGPASFGPHEGFRFDFSYNREGLDYRGVAVGALIGGKLNMILYIGTRLHYFDKYRDTFDRIVASIQQA